MHPVLFRIGPITIYSYGLMLALAFFVGTYLAQLRARKAGVGQNKIMDLSLYILVSAILGARVLFVILNWNDYQNNFWDIFKIWEGGLVFYGGLILAFFVAVWFLKKNKLPIWKVTDIFAPSLALGMAIGRIGCFLNGCCYGKISYPLGICFPSSASVFTQQASDGLITQNAKFSLPVLPTQLYESLACLIIFFILLFIEKYKKFDGFLFWNFVLLYSVFRFIIEGFRFYEKNFILFGWLTISQLISIILAIISLLILNRSLLKKKLG